MLFRSAISPPRHQLPAPALVLTGDQHGIHCPIHVQIAEEAIDTLFLS